MGSVEQELGVKWECFTINYTDYNYPFESQGNMPVIWLLFSGENTLKDIK